MDRFPEMTSRSVDQSPEGEAFDEAADCANSAWVRAIFLSAFASIRLLCRQALSREDHEAVGLERPWSGPEAYQSR